MCGITGIWQPAAERSDAELRAIVSRMTDSLRHRGPDDEGVWADASAGIALGHRRLSIVDLSASGHQPMSSASGRFQLSYNGEVYNHQPLRQELAARGHTFRGHSDTEVMLAAIEEWGLAAAVARFVGMFAFALWDARQQELTLVRDRLGIKPLYYGCWGQELVFASELKPLRTHPSFTSRVDRGALALFLQHSYIPAPCTIDERISKLLPGTMLAFSRDAWDRPRVHHYWDYRGHARRAEQDPDPPSEDTPAIEQLEQRLGEAVRLRMLADVPVGAFLSGGIDSSLVVALMRQQSSAAVRTFCIGFSERAYDEAPYARRIAEHLGTEHIEHTVTPQEARDVIPRLPEMFDEPFGDSSQIPTFLVSQLARRHVTVSLSGDGGDELFGGYPRYARTERVWRALRLLPGAWRRRVSRMIRAHVPRRSAGPLRKLHTLSGLLDPPDLAAVYARLHGHWREPEQVVLGGSRPTTWFSDPQNWQLRRDVRDQLALIDVLTYLPDDILTKVDRASMAVSLEARVPLLDHRVVEFAARLPRRMRVRDGQTKWLLRRVLEQYVPRELFERPKVGFGVPLRDWLRGPLRDWGAGLLDERRLRADGFFEPAPLQAAWQAHQRGEEDRCYELWDVLMFQAWRMRWEA